MIQSVSCLDHAHIWRYPLSGPPDVCTIVFPLYVVVEREALQVPLKYDLLDGIQPKQLQLLQMLVFLQELQGIVKEGLDLDLVAWVRDGQPLVKVAKLSATPEELLEVGTCEEGLQLLGVQATPLEGGVASVEEATHLYGEVSHG